jgi:hypothetical protein
LPVEPVERHIVAGGRHGNDVHLGRPEEMRDWPVHLSLLQLPHGGRSCHVPSLFSTTFCLEIVAPKNKMIKIKTNQTADAFLLLSADAQHFV